MARTSSSAAPRSRTTSESPSGPGRGSLAVLWVLLAVSYLAALLPGSTPGVITLVVGLVPVAFSLWHFTLWAGARVAWLSFAAVVIVSFFGEALGVATGLVFGTYYYPDGPLGPLLLGVPPLIQLQYFAMAYASIMLARAISGTLATTARGWVNAGIAALAAFGMTILDLSSDPWHSTILGQWIWTDGGSYFGVPIHNFFGWFVETFVFLIIVQWLLSSRGAAERITQQRSGQFYTQGVLLFGTFPVAVMLIPYLTAPSMSAESQVIADAMFCIALFAVVPLWVAALFGLRRVLREVRKSGS